MTTNTTKLKTKRTYNRKTKATKENITPVKKNKRNNKNTSTVKTKNTSTTRSIPQTKTIIKKTTSTKKKTTSTVLQYDIAKFHIPVSRVDAVLRDAVVGEDILNALEELKPPQLKDDASVEMVPINQMSNATQHIVSTVKKIYDDYLQYDRPKEEKVHKDHVEAWNKMTGEVFIEDKKKNEKKTKNENENKVLRYKLDNKNVKHYEPGEFVFDKYQGKTEHERAIRMIKRLYLKYSNKIGIVLAIISNKLIEELIIQGIQNCEGKMVNVDDLLAKRTFLGTRKNLETKEKERLYEETPLEELLLKYKVGKGNFNSLIPLILPLETYYRAKNGFYEDKEGDYRNPQDFRKYYKDFTNYARSIAIATKEEYFNNNPDKNVKFRKSVGVFCSDLINEFIHVLGHIIQCKMEFFGRLHPPLKSRTNNQKGDSDKHNKNKSKTVSYQSLIEILNNLMIYNRINHAKYEALIIQYDSQYELFREKRKENRDNKAPKSNEHQVETKSEIEDSNNEEDDPEDDPEEDDDEEEEDEEEDPDDDEEDITHEDTDED